MVTRILQNGRTKSQKDSRQVQYQTNLGAKFGMVRTEIKTVSGRRRRKLCLDSRSAQDTPMSSRTLCTTARRLLPHRVLPIHTSQTFCYLESSKLVPSRSSSSPPSPTRNVEVFPERPNVQNTIQISKYHLLLVGSYLSRQLNINTRSVRVPPTAHRRRTSSAAYVV